MGLSEKACYKTSSLWSYLYKFGWVHIEVIFNKILVMEIWWHFKWVSRLCKNERMYELLCTLAQLQLIPNLVSSIFPLTFPWTPIFQANPRYLRSSQSYKHPLVPMVFIFIMWIWNHVDFLFEFCPFFFYSSCALWNNVTENLEKGMVHAQNL